jgi:Trk-type K+ transport system membrane component
VGLSTGLSAELSPGAQFILVVLMYVGRVGTVTAASALALRPRQRLYCYPEERPIVG